MKTQVQTKPTIATIAKFEDQEISLPVWLDRRRGKGKLQFLVLRDGTGYIQAVLNKREMDEEVFDEVKRLGQESSMVVRGWVRKDDRSKIGYEIHATDVKVVFESQDFPITPKEHGTDFLMDHRHLWLRSRRQFAILKIRASIMKAMCDWLDEQGFLRVDTPILTPNSCEGTTTLFSTDYFGEEAFLSQTGQLYNEATAAAFGKVYTFGPTFRAEKSKTRRHLMEFWMCEPEIAFCDYLENMEIQEAFVQHVVATILEKHPQELELLERDLEPLKKVAEPFPRVHYDEAVQILKDNGVDFEWGNDFGGGDETILSSHFGRPIFVTHFPTQIKAFYMQPDPDRPEVVLGSDLLAPEGYGEVIGGGQRIADLELLEKRLAEHELDPKDYQWYLDLRRFGSQPHSGFGIGLERTVAWICGLEHIRETSAFPRMLYRNTP